MTGLGFFQGSEGRRAGLQTRRGLWLPEGKPGLDSGCVEVLGPARAGHLLPDLRRAEPAGV